MAWWKEIRSIVVETIDEWLADGVPGKGAALSYYVLLSLGPFLVLLAGVFQLFVGEETLRREAVAVVTEVAGSGAAATVAGVLERIDPPSLLAPESIVAIVALAFGATGAFANVRGSLNAIWGVEPGSRSRWKALLGMLEGRGRAFIMIAATGLLLAVSFVVSWLLGLLDPYLAGFTVLGPSLVTAIDAVASLLLTGVLFGMLFRTLPATRIEWRTVWVGAFATALLFTLGKLLVARLIAGASWTSYYGPAASLVAFLAWIYFSAQIFYLGAEFTQVWSHRRGGALARPRPRDPDPSAKGPGRMSGVVQPPDG